MAEDAAQQIVDSFVAGMVAGRRMPILQAGGTSTCQVYLDQDVTAITIKGRANQVVSLDDIAAITMGEDLPEGVQLSVDELCVTMALYDGSSLAFRMEDMEARDTFALCIGMFVDQRNQGEYEDEGDVWATQPDEGEPLVPSAPSGAGASSDRAQPFLQAGGGQHDYQLATFWKPTWCDVCKEFLQGWSDQGMACRSCRQVVCHSCVNKGGPCRGHDRVAAAGPSPAAGGAPAESQQAPSRQRPAAVPPPPAAGGRQLQPREAEGEDGLNDSQRLVKRFVQQMVKGRVLEMLSKVGGSVECLVRLDRELKNIMIQRAGKKDGKQRAIPLTTVQDVCMGREVADEVELPVDEQSVTLMLDQGQAIAFRFDGDQDRDTFVKCMSMFVEGNRKEAKHRKKGGPKKRPPKTSPTTPQTSERISRC